MNKRNLVSRLLALCGIICLALGALTAGPVWGQDYNDKLKRCNADCQRSYLTMGYKSSADCQAAECAKYENVRCSALGTCLSCGARSAHIKLDSGIGLL